MSDNAFRLSRIHAEGWNTARKFPANDLADLSETKIDALNPYSAGPERDRWSTGFKSALQR